MSEHRTNCRMGQLGRAVIPELVLLSKYSSFCTYLKQHSLAGRRALLSHGRSWGWEKLELRRTR
eukprot:2755767-Rhodomonas_salina.1